VRTPEQYSASDWEAIQKIGVIRSTYEKLAMEALGKHAKDCTWTEIFSLPAPCIGRYPLISPDEMAALKAWTAALEMRLPIPDLGVSMPEELNHAHWFCAFQCKNRRACWNTTHGGRQEDIPF